jgi:hypothetical protein
VILGRKLNEKNEANERGEIHAAAHPKVAPKLRQTLITPKKASIGFDLRTSLAKLVK